MTILKNLATKAQDMHLPSLPYHLKYWKWIRLSALVGADIVLISGCYWSAYLLRLDVLNLGIFQSVFLRTLPLMLVVHLLTFKWTGMYRQVWRHATLSSAVMVMRSVAIATLIFVMLNFLLAFDRMPPRSVPIIYALLATLSITTVRFSWRVWTTFRAGRRASGKERCLIYGAGGAGNFMVRNALAAPNFPYEILGFIDDDKNKIGRMLHGLRIFGTGQDLAQLVQEHQATTIIIAMHSIPGRVLRDIFSRCVAAGIKPLIMPDLANSLGTDVIKPRPIDVKDLLRRAPKSIDRPLVESFFEGSSVLVTGAGGSIGSETCRQLAGLNPREIILFDASEYNLYRIEMELQQLVQGKTRIHAVLGSTCDRPVVDRVFETYRPSCVIHAAAYKHVSLVERNPLVGIVNNILGTKNIAEAAVTSGTKHFLLISTDKAVRPTSVMGATKRCCELLVQAIQQFSGDRCQFSSVRFGNVLGSSGSVIPRFIEQIQAGGPVTVTHPEVTRYFMLIPEAVALCLQSMAFARGGNIYLLNMGEPVKIQEMAHHLISLAGKEPGKDVEIVYTGLQPGEKLYEELILEGHEQQTQHDDLFVTVPQPINGPMVLHSMESILDLAANNDEVGCVKALNRIVFDQVAQAGTQTGTELRRTQESTIESTADADPRYPRIH